MGEPTTSSSTTWFNSLYKGPSVTFECNSLDELGAALIKLRQVREWSQKDLAVRLGVAQQQVQRWERNGWQNISMWRLQEVVEVMGVELDIKLALPSWRVLASREREQKG